MKKALFGIIAACGLILYSSACVTGTAKTEHKPFTVDFSAPELTIYDIASAITGCPPEIVKGFHFAESSYGKNLNHPDKLDRGDFGLHEDPAYHAERAAKWGEYNPDCPLQSAIIAGRIYMENLRILGNKEDAIAAYKQGIHGLYRDGRAEWYVERVLGIQRGNIA